MKRLVIVTGSGARDSKGHVGFWYDRIFNPRRLKTIYADKDRQEATDPAGRGGLDHHAAGLSDQRTIDRQVRGEL